MFSFLLTLLVAVTAVNARPRSATEPRPALDEFLAQTVDLEIRATNATTALPNAGVKLCTEPDFKGSCASVSWPVNECIDLRDYAGVVKSFLPSAGFECLLMQNRCDATAPYADIEAKDTAEGSDLSALQWIAESKSYICFTDTTALRRFVRVSRQRLAGASNVDASL